MNKLTLIAILLISALLTLFVKSLLTNKTSTNDSVVIPIEGTINEELADYVIERLLLAKQTNSPVILKISSPGGSVFAGNKILSYMENLELKEVITYCTNLCASMAAHIFVAGNIRIMAPNSVLMFHPMSLTYSGYLSDFESMMRLILLIDKKLNDKILSIVPENYRDVILQAKSKEVWLLAEEALELQLTHRIGLVY